MAKLHEDVKKCASDSPTGHSPVAKAERLNATLISSQQYSERKSLSWSTSPGPLLPEWQQGFSCLYLSLRSLLMFFFKKIEKKNLERKSACSCH